MKRAVEVFQDACPHSICDELFRVDVFMNQANIFIVNEFESLEAVYYGKSIFESTVLALAPLTEGGLGIERKDIWITMKIPVTLINNINA